MSQDQESGAEVEEVQAKAVALRPYERFARHIQERAEIDSQNRGDDLTYQNMDTILTAQTEEEMWDAGLGGMLNGTDLDGVFQRVHGFTVGKSNRDDITKGFGVYYIVNATNLHTGEDFVWNTSAPDVISRLKWLEANDKFPADVMVKAFPQPSGNTLLRLRPVPKTALQSTPSA